MSTRALLVCLENYANPKHNLPGVSNDVSSFVRVLSKFGITDLEVIRDQNATSANIKKGLNALVSSANPGDVRIFYYTGHGTRIPPKSVGLSGERALEAFVPHEGTSDSLIPDTWMAQFLTRVPENCFFYAVLDCCYSGEMYKSFALETKEPSPVEKLVSFEALTQSGVPDLADPAYNIKRLLIEDSLPFSAFLGASEPEQTALVLSIDGARRSVFTWALEAVVEPGMPIGKLEALLSAKQKEKTNHHVPYVAIGQAVSDREIFR